MTERRRLPEQATLLTAAAGTPATASASQRTITGLALPYGPVGQSSLGPVTFAKGAVTWSEVGRIKLLRQHDPGTVLGYALSLQDREDGLYGTFAVPESPEGDTALLEAADGRRDGLSVGVTLSTETLSELIEKWWEGDETPTAAAGQLREVSQVSIPAFDDARVDGSAAALAAELPQLLTLSVSFGAPPATEPTPAAPAAPTQEEPTMTAATVPTAAPSAAVDVTPAAAPPAATPPAPAAAAGAATVLAEAPVYTFDGNGHSLVRDAYRARFDGDTDAAARMAKLNAMLRESINAPMTATGGRAVNLQAGILSHRFASFAVETRSSASNFIQNGYRPELLVASIDRGRPINSRLTNRVNLTDATPFRLPVEGDFYRATTVADGATTASSKTVTSATAAFTATDVGRAISGGSIPTGAVIEKVNSATSVNVSRAATATATGVSLTIKRAGVSDHTEGQAHTTEGDVDVSDVTFTPGAVSGAYRLSRELVDASNPALDNVALRGMARDYRYATESKAVAALAAAGGTAIASVNTAIEMRGALADFYDLTDEDADFVALAPNYWKGLAIEVAGDGRPQLPYLNPTNALGQSDGPSTLGIDGATFTKSGRIGADLGYIVKSDDVLVGESAVQTFRFEEVEGPGVVKLALWAYYVAGVTRWSAVQAVSFV